MLGKDWNRRHVLLGMGAAAMTTGLLSTTRRATAQGGNADPVKLLLGSHMGYLQKLAPAYAAQFGPTPEIELVTTPDLAVKLNSSLIARRSPGDAVFVTAALVAGLADKGWLTDLSDLVETELLPNGLIPNSLTASRYKGRFYGVPVTIGAPIMHWNKKMFEAAGLDPEAPADWHATPGSWDTMVDHAKAMTDADNNVYGVTDNWGGVGSVFTFGTLLQGNGGRFLDDDLNPVMNSEAGVEALSRMVDLLHVHKVVDPAVVTYTWVFDASPAYLAGTRGIFFTWPFIAGIANGGEDSKVKGASGYAPNPALETSASVDGSEFLAIPRFAKNAAGGRQFIEMATTLENQIVQGSTSPWAPSVDVALSHPEVVANLPFAEVIKQSYQYPVDGGYSTDREKWLEILTGQLSRAFARKAGAPRSPRRGGEADRGQPRVAEGQAQPGLNASGLPPAPLWRTARRDGPCAGELAPARGRLRLRAGGAGVAAGGRDLPLSGDCHARPERDRVRHGAARDRRLRRLRQIHQAVRPSRLCRRDPGGRSTFGLLIAAASGVLGFLIAMLLDQAFYGRTVVRVAVVLPWAVPPVVAGVLWGQMFHADVGFVNALLTRLGGDRTSTASGSATAGPRCT